MEVKTIIAELDKEIARLKEARTLLAGGTISSRGGKQSSVKPRRSTMSAEGRRRIAEAMKKRWAERRKQQVVKK